MDDAKKQRTTVARKVTRKINELNTAIKGGIHFNEIQEKIDALKLCMNELGTSQDRYLQHLYDDDSTDETKISEEEKWFENYDAKTNEIIKQARIYSDGTGPVATTVKHVKLKKLEIPKFSGDPKDFYKWKSVYDRYTKDYDEETKYDYLLSSTLGEARRYVENRSTFDEAMTRLNDKYGNIHTIMGIMINEIKSCSLVRRGDFKAFEQFSLKVDEFYDRLKLMGKANDVENSYILRELESKLNPDDVQKWLESNGEYVDTRQVEDLIKWLEHQAHLRRITYNNPGAIRNIPPSTKRDNLSRTSGSTSVGVCLGCSSPNHHLAECSEFLQLNNDARWERVKSLRCCFNCLKFGHRGFECSEGLCSVCSRPHHYVLHRFMVNDPSSQVLASSPVCRNEGKQLQISRSCLPIMRVQVKSAQRSRICTVSLDSHSEINIISSRCAQQLGLVGEPFLLIIEGAGGVKTMMRTKIVCLKVVDRSGESHELECVVLNKACGRAVKIDKKLISNENVKTLKEMGVYTEGGEIDLLIGMTNPLLHKQIALIPFVDMLYVMETCLGHCLVGSNPTTKVYEVGQYNVNSICVLDHDSDEMLWRNHLEAEMAGIIPVECHKSEDELKFENRMKIERVEGEGNRLRVSLAWKINPETFENNRQQALENDIRLLRQLKKNQEVLEIFEEQFNEMVVLKVLRKVDQNFPKRYLPLLAVTDLERESTKVRICLDAKRKFNGISFNDFLLNGKLEMNDILQVLTNFRAGNTAIQGDIRKMFWQIMLSDYDQQFHGVLYKGETFVFTRVCFGDKPSPIIADSCMKMIANEGKEQYPEGAGIVGHKRFVDDLLDAGVDDLKMEKKINETTELLGKYGFEVKEWLSNRESVGKVKRNGKVLGLLWDGEKDSLSVRIKSVGEQLGSFNKRGILRSVAKIWDPIGILCALIIIGKLIFQSVVRMKVSWDEEVLDEELHKKWQLWLTELGKCEGFFIPRSILPSKGNLRDMNFELVGCSDGSSVAYGSAVYIRWYDEKEENVELKFIAGKGKLNPIKGTTVPRSELCGALLAAQLVHSAEKTLKESDIGEHFRDKILLSDSTTAISWVKSASIKYKPFVKHKVMKCQELQPACIWDFIPGRENTAADLISKGCRFKDLETIMKGPDMLYLPRKEWANLPNQVNDEEVNSEKCVVAQVNSIMFENSCIDVTKYGSWIKLVRVTAYVFKFLTPKQHVGNLDYIDDILPILSESELKKAEEYWIKRAQADLDLSDRKYQSLCPFKDENGIVRIYGRLKNMNAFDNDRKHPILLSKDHPISLLITQQKHEDILHPGHSRVIAEVRKKFWIVGVRSIAKSIEKKCVTCRRWRGMACEQMMANLPSFRLNASCPFENTAIDYFGPFDMKYGYRGRKKAYGVIFTCLTTRAVQVELATDLSTDTFLLAFRRFISLYGTPCEVRSDNGRNFIGAANEIKKND